MSTPPRSPAVQGPTEPLLGPWSLTALAALLVVGGILMFLPGGGTSPEGETGASSLHPVVRSLPPVSHPVRPATPEVQKATAAIPKPEAAAGETTESEEVPLAKEDSFGDSKAAARDH